MAQGATRARRYSLGFREITKRFPTGTGTTEDAVWRDFVKPTLPSLSRGAVDICHYGVTEIVNNALDHSDTDHFLVAVAMNPVLVRIQVLDSGVGIFAKIAREFDLEDEAHAAFELSKGKLTTDPQRHTGEGIFFTSRMFDRFLIASGRLHYLHSTTMGDWVLSSAHLRRGTLVTMEVNPSTRRKVRAVFDEFTTGEDDPSFSVTHVPVEMVEVGEENLVSRSQGKRVMARMHAFKRIVLDFKGVRSIGQGFADEVFRVWAGDHPHSELIAVNGNRDVERMIARALDTARTS